MKEKVGMKKTRDIQLDFVRTIATFFVMSVHFFLKTGFYKQKILGLSMLAPLMFRTLFMTCVPLFIILSGFLLNYRKITIKHFASLRKVLLQYFLCTIFLFAFDVVMGWRAISFKAFVENVLAFGQYSWYVKKYILLFLIMPFINLFFQKNESNKIRRLFLTVLMAIVLIPSTLELVGGGTGLFDVLLKVSDKLYPALYYSVGVYYFYNKKKLVKDYSSKFLLGALIGVILLSSIVSYKRYTGGVYLWENWNSYNGIFVFLCATILFLLLMEVNLSGIKASMTGRAIELFSQTSFYIYLLSYIFDNIYYSLFADISILSWIKYPVIPLLVFLSAFVLGLMVDKIYKRINEKIDFVINEIRGKANIKQ